MLGLALLATACEGRTGLEVPDDASVTRADGGAIFALAVAATYTHTCALLSDHTVACWGYNAVGQLGDGTTTNSPTPVRVSRLTEVIAISAANWVSCALVAGGTVKCWGHNDFGQLGDGTTRDSATPVTVLGVRDITTISADANLVCAIHSDSTATCWGFPNGPTAWTSLTDVRAIVHGAEARYALMWDGSVQSWGFNQFGELGDGTFAAGGGYIPSATPTRVKNLQGATFLSASAYYACAVSSEGTVTCWGGLPPFLQTNSTCVADAACAPVPVVFPGLGHVTQLTVGAAICVIRDNGEVACIGDNTYGQLGNGTTIASNTLVPLPSASPAHAITADGGHACALLADGSVECWGNNSWGQLGDGTTSHSSVPVHVRLPVK
jgi:alpha-tubulin suppressor-like RCC1 family protein